MIYLGENEVFLSSSNKMYANVLCEEALGWRRVQICCAQPDLGNNVLSMLTVLLILKIGGSECEGHLSFSLD